jgi:FkbM family methyltransferase
LRFDRSFAIERIKSIFAFLLSLSGFKFHTHNLRGLFAYLKDHEINIDNVLDIGAYHGTWSEKVRYFVPNAEFTLIEANQVHIEQIKKRGFSCINVILSQSDAKRTFYGSGTTGDSLYPELNVGDTLPTSRSEETRSLNSLFKSFGNIPIPDLVKIDTQGSELEVLKGGMEVISKAKVIILELSVMPYNIGAPNFSECVDFLIQSDFIPVYCCEVHIVRDCLVQLDLAFLRKDIFEMKFGSMTSRGFYGTALLRYSDKYREST